MESAWQASHGVKFWIDWLDVSKELLNTVAVHKNVVTPSPNKLFSIVNLMIFLKSHLRQNISFSKNCVTFLQFFKKKRKAPLLISKEEKFICNFNGFFLNLKPQVNCPMLLKKFAAVLLYSLHSQLWANIMLGLLWWSFFFVGKKNAKRQHWFIFWGKISPFFKNKSQNFILFFWERFSPQVYILATLFNGPVQNHRQLNANLFGETLHCCYTTQLGKQSKLAWCVFSPSLNDSC